MTETPEEPLSDDDMTTSGTDSGDSDPMGGGGDADGTDSDSSDSTDGDSSDADGTDGGDDSGTAL